MRKLYARLGSMLYWLTRPFFHFVPETRRVRCLIVADQRILLIKNWLGRRLWTLPGGGMRRRETPKQATIRELREELGIRVRPDQLYTLGQWSETVDGLMCCMELVQLTVNIEQISPRQREIIDNRWFTLDHLPADRAPVVDEALRQLSHKR